MIRKPPLPRSALMMRLTALTGLLLAMLAGPSAVQAQGCLSAAETRQVIASNQILSLSAVSSIVRARGYSQVGSASVCGSPGSYVYNVVAIAPNGTSGRLTVDAASGAVLAERR